jgi:hypothetical protein
MTTDELIARRKKFFEEMNKEYPSMGSFIATNSGIIEPMPQTQDEWDNFHENLQFVEGFNRAV